MPQHELQTQPLVGLEPVGLGFDLDQPIATRSGEELNEIGKAGAIGSDIAHDIFEPKPKMFGRKTCQRRAQQWLVDESPCDERRGYSMTFRKAPQNGVPVGAALQLGKTGGTFSPAALIKFRTR